MSKLYQLNRMRYAPAAGGLLSFLSPIAKFVSGGVSKLFGSKAAQVVSTVAKNPLVQGVALGAGSVAATNLLSGGGGGGGATGGWPRRRRRGITATELRGYRKVANLIHKEGMVSKRARGRH